MSTEAPFGTWKSPITTELITGHSTPVNELAVDHQDIYWIESHPKEGGRYTIMRCTPDGLISECTPPDFYARTTVHEYGGAAFTVADGIIYFANFKDQHLYRQRPGEKPRLLTPGEGYRYADIVMDRKRNRLICIREDHAGVGEPVNTIVSVSLAGNDNGSVLVEGSTFYSSARLSPDGTRLAYLTWNHPNMPWDGCELWLAEIQPEGSLRRATHIAGSETESLFQPEWSPDGILHFVAETSGWWNLYRWKGGQVEPLCPMQAEFGEPQWVFGMFTYDFVSPQRILACYSQNGIWHLAFIDTTVKKLTPIDTPFSEISDIRVGEGFAAFIAGSPTQPASIMRMDLISGKMELIKQAFEVGVDSGYFSVPQPVTFANTNGRESHAFYFPTTI